MEPLVPDWRTLGGGTPAGAVAGIAPAPQQSARRTIVITPRLVTWLVAGLLAAALTGGAAFLALMPGTGGVVIQADVADAPSTNISATTGAGPGLAGVVLTPPTDLVVDVEGAVAHPGLVHVAAGGRVGDALTKAGGFAANADLTRTASDLNLAQPVSDGLKVVVPTIGQGAIDPEPANTAPSRSGPATAPGPIDLNHATEAQLDTLPGVGPATIAKIVAARQSTPFASVEDLRTRGVVGDAALQKLKGLVTVGH